MSADIKQYLRIEIDGQTYLLPNAASVTIEQRDSLIGNDNSDSNVAAWRDIKSQQWPAYCLDRRLNVSRRDDWQRVVFLEAKPNPVGIMADEVQLLPRTEMLVTRFSPLGNPPTKAGHIFSAAWVHEDRAILVFEPNALIAYLQNLGEE